MSARLQYKKELELTFFKDYEKVKAWFKKNNNNIIKMVANKINYSLLQINDDKKTIKYNEDIPASLREYYSINFEVEESDINVLKTASYEASDINIPLPMLKDYIIELMEKYDYQVTTVLRNKDGALQYALTTKIFNPYINEYR